MLDKFITAAFEALTVVGCLIGALFVFMAIGRDVSAPQGAHLAAVGIGFAVVPYCLAGVCHRGAVRRMMSARQRSDL